MSNLIRRLSFYINLTLTALYDTPKGETVQKIGLLVNKVSIKTMLEAVLRRKTFLGLWGCRGAGMQRCGGSSIRVLECSGVYTPFFLPFKNGFKNPSKQSHYVLSSLKKSKKKGQKKMDIPPFGLNKYGFS